MNQTPEESTAGKGNFLNAAMGRRQFLKHSAAAGVVAGGSLGGFYFGYRAAVSDPVRVGVIGTGDEGSVLIGAINPEFIQVKSIADIRPYSIHRAFHGDWYSDAALKARPGLMKVYGWKTEAEARENVKVYGPDEGGYEGLIKNAKQDGIEAVIIALPLHLHAAAAIVAMRRGLHVLTEKLMGHSIHECKEMARVATETHKYLATGHQRHYNILYANAVDLIQRGQLGDLHFIRAQWHRGNMPDKDSWKQPMPEQVKPDDTLAGRLLGDLKSWQAKLATATLPKDIEQWTKRVAQKRKQIADEVLKDTATDFGYQRGQYEDAGGEVVYRRPPAEELIRWRLWDRTGRGLMAELGSHQLDAAGIFISAAHGGQKQQPLNVLAAANRPIFPADREVDDHVYCMFEFPAPGYNPKDKRTHHRRICVQYSSINGNGFGGYGEVVFGTKGTLVLEREMELTLLERESESKISVDTGSTLDTQATGPMQAAGGEAAAEVSRGYAEEEEHWAWCIREDPDNEEKRIQPRCHPKVALADAVIALTTNLSAKQRRPIRFQKDWFLPERNETPEGIAPDVNREQYTL
ncbi:MAG: Gfo/Idh/MocA family protein [Planctomycetota bacterium]|jgi:predicted dehydrogenase